MLIHVSAVHSSLLLSSIYGWDAPVCLTIHPLRCSSCFQFLGITNEAILNICVQVLCEHKPGINFSGVVARSVIAGSYDNLLSEMSSCIFCVFSNWID